MYFGTFHHAIDAKGRTSLPARLRDALTVAQEPRIHLVQYPYWKAVMVLPDSLWKRAMAKVMSASPLDARAQRNILKFVSSAQEVELDVHGRVLVPPALRAWAGLQKDVVWVGMGTHIQLLDKAEHEARMAEEIPADQVVDIFGA